MLLQQQIKQRVLVLKSFYFMGCNGLKFTKSGVKSTENIIKGTDCIIEELMNKIIPRKYPLQFGCWQNPTVCLILNGD